MAKKTVNITMVDVDIKIRDDLQKIAEVTGRSMSKQAIKFMEFGLEKHPDIKLIKETK